MNEIRWFVFSVLCLLGPAGGAWGRSVDVVVIGAGLSGLATAYHLKKAGLSYRILELTPRIGGRVRTMRYQFPGEKATYVDSGMEEYWASNPAVDFLERLKLPVRREEAISSIRLGGTLYTLRDDDTYETFTGRLFTAAERTALESFKESLKPKLAVLKPDHSVAIPSELLALKDQSFAEWVRAQKLPEKVSEWIRISVECEAGTSWESFSALDGIAELHIFMGKGEDAIRVIGGNETFTQKLAEAIGLSTIRLNRRVSRIESTPGGGMRVSSVDMKSHRHEQWEATAVVTTVPLFRAALEIQFVPPLSAEKMAAIQSQTWGSYFKAHVFVKDRPEIAKRSWAPSGSSILPILSDSPLGVIYDGSRDRPTPTKILSLLVTGADAERFNLMPLGIVEKTLRAEFDKLWPGFSKDIQGMEFFRFHPRAIAGWPVGRSRFDALSDAIRKPENGIYFAGDFTESTHSDGAFWSAKRVADQIVSARVSQRALVQGRARVKTGQASEVPR